MGWIWTGKNDGLGVLILNLKKMWPKVLQEQEKIEPEDNGDDDGDDESFGAGSRKKFGVRPLAGKQTLSPAEVSPADQKVEADMIKLNTRVEVKKASKSFCPVIFQTEANTGNFHNIPTSLIRCFDIRR